MLSSEGAANLSSEGAAALLSLRGAAEAISITFRADVAEIASPHRGSQ
jgi:hypothetical protein